MMEQADSRNSPENMRRVCIVDDDPGIRDSLRFLFEDVGYEVAEENDGVDAVRFLQQARQPWVVLLDRTMPRMDGIGVLRMVASQPAVRQRTAILFMTARNDPPGAEIGELIRSQVFAVLSKPFNLDTLLDAAERASQQLQGG